MASSEPERRNAGTGRMPRRGTDIVEDAVVWMLSSLALLLVVVAVTAGLAVYGHIADRGRAESEIHTPVRAALLEEVPVQTGDAGYRLPVKVEANWTAPDGSQRTGSVQVTGPMPAGAEVPVWVDQQGNLVSQPPTMSEAAFTGVITAAFVLAAGGAVLAAGWALARRAIGAGNSRRWEREWADVGPGWSARR